MKLIFTGMVLVTLSVAGAAYAVPQGPLWLIAVLAAAAGTGFGMAWAFMLRQMMALARPEDIERVAGAVSSIAPGSE